MTESELLKAINEATQPRPDPSKGLTPTEWGVKWNLSRSQAARKIKDALLLGLMVRDEDVRPVRGGVFRHVEVYRAKMPRAPRKSTS